MHARSAALDFLGIERWELRGSSPPPPPAVVLPSRVSSAASATPAAPATPAPAAAAAAAASLRVPPIVADTAWEPLCSEVAGCVACGLAAGRTQTVFGVGNRAAEWLVIGEAPGAEEDRQGKPFVGRAGGLLDSMLRAIGLERDAVFIANILKCRPPHNRDPRPDEVAACLPFLHRQIALLKPRLILAVGRIAAQNLLGSDAPIGRLRGQVHRFGAADLPLIVTYHPAYLLRSPGEKRKSWEDLKLARRVHAELTQQRQL